jgi:magnesium-transporting ATPase (P-type)
MGQVGNVLACRTSRVSLFKTYFSRNKWILIGMASQVFILSFLIYVPLMQRVFGTTTIDAYDWAYLVALALVVVFADEVRKWLVRRFGGRNHAHNSSK